MGTPSINTINLHLTLEETKEILALLREHEQDLPADMLDKLYPQLENQDFFKLAKKIQNYSSFKTLDMIEEQFDVDVAWENLFSQTQHVEPSPHLREDLETDNQPVINSESSRREGLIFPILKEIKKKNKDQINLFSGETFDVNREAGLTGACDYLLVGVPDTQIIKRPVFALVEAKRKTIRNTGEISFQFFTKLFSSQQGKKSANSPAIRLFFNAAGEEKSK